MEQAFWIVVSVVVLGILVFVHEFGHFIIAKACRVAVLEFALGFGKKLTSFVRGGTEYTWRLIPLGGFVRMAGDDPFEVYGDTEKDKLAVASTPDTQEDTKPVDLEAQAKEAAAEKAQAEEIARRKAILDAIPSDRWFLNKGLPSKAAIVLAGPVFNLLFAWALAIFSFAYWGKTVELDVPIIGNVLPDYPAHKAGIRPGDRVLSINGKEMISWRSLAESVRESSGEPMHFKVRRAATKEDAKALSQTSSEVSSSEVAMPSGDVVEQEITVSGMPDIPEMALLDGSDNQEKSVKSFKVGVVASTQSVPVSLSDAFVMGSYQVVAICELNYRILKALVQGVIAPSKVVGGPIAVFQGAAQSAKRGMEVLADFMVLLSVSLAIFNLLPVPVLDGGHLLFFAIEAVRRRPLSLKWQAIANQVGMILLLSLMVYAVSNDIIRLL